MPKPKDTTAYTESQKIEVVTKQRLKTQVNAEKTRDENTDLIRFRVKKGRKDQIQAYVATLPEYSRIADTGKHKGETVPNVNQWLADLVLAALPPEYHVLPDSSKSDKLTE